MSNSRKDLLEQGIEDGYAKARFEFIADMLLVGRTPEAISEFCRIPLEEVKTVQAKTKKILSYAT